MICTEGGGNEDDLDKAAEPIEIHALFSLGKAPSDPLLSSSLLQNDTLQISKPYDPILCSALLQDEGILVLANSSLHVLSYRQESVLQVDRVLLDMKVLKMEPIEELGIILCLTDSAQLVIVCQLTWTVQKCDVENVNDFTIVSDLSESSDYCVLISTSVPEILLMTLPGTYFFIN